MKTNKLHKVWLTKYSDFMQRELVVQEITYKHWYKEWLVKMKAYYELPTYKRIFTKVPKISPDLIDKYGINKHE